jgi:hypothetical protein
VLKAPDALLTLNDSKKLSRPKREAMFDSVKDACVCYAIASASVEEIDTMNILEADFLAMRRALTALGMPGLDAPAPEIPVECRGSLAESAALFEAAQYYALKCDYDRAEDLDERSFAAEKRYPRFQDELQAIADIHEIRGDFKKAADTWGRIVDLLEKEWGLTEETELKQAREKRARLMEKTSGR